MLSVVFFIVMLSVIMLNVVILSVVAPNVGLSKRALSNLRFYLHL